MPSLPRWLLRHTITIEPYEGTNAYGEVYGPAVTVPAFVDDTRRLVRNPDGREVTSSSTAFVELATHAPAGSRVTLPRDRVSYVITVAYRDGGGLPTPDHCEISIE